MSRSALRLETRRLLLREWRNDDVEGWVAMNGDERVMAFFPSTYDRVHAEASAAKLRAALERDGYGWWIMDVRHGPSFAGVIALQDVPFEAPFTPALEIGWRLIYDAWGHGYATEGAMVALRFAFDTLGRNEVVAYTAENNVRSRRVMERLGMTHGSEDDFEHPRLAVGHPLRRHVLYRARSSQRN